MLLLEVLCSAREAKAFRKKSSGVKLEVIGANVDLR
jgi:hypothetical protein